MNGQWIGRVEGSNVGSMIVNLDLVGQTLRGTAILNPDDQAMPSIIAAVSLSVGRKDINLPRVQVLPLNPRTGDAELSEAVRQAYPGVIFPSYASVRGAITPTSLTLEWNTDIGTNGRSTLNPSRAAAPSDYPSEQLTWSAFKELAGEMQGRRALYRGQEKPWRLRTAYHRTGRADLYRFLREDRLELLRQLSALTRHQFNLDMPDENGAFLNLVQHHGYPTPLLDWTYSPYVAAFFAYRMIKSAAVQTATPNDRVRVIIFDYKAWSDDWKQLGLLIAAREHFSILQCLSIENARMIPQQAVVTATNVDDIETYVRFREGSKDRAYLRMVDLPVSEKPTVMKELDLMGVTAGSLFPGLDGACEELRERNFVG